MATKAGAIWFYNSQEVLRALSLLTLTETMLDFPYTPSKMTRYMCFSRV